MKKRLYIITTVSALLVLAGVALLLYPKLTDIRYDLFQNGLEEQARESGSASSVLPDGTVCKLSIPEIDLKAYVVSGTSQAALKNGPGHYEDTPLPGEGGNVGIAGHRTMYGHPFRHLDKLNEGDEIVAQTADGEYTYQVVEKKTVKPSDVSVVDPTEKSILTLTTCHPVGSAARRLIIVAEIMEG